MDTTQTTTHIGLCAGYGGIELGLKRVIPNLRTVAYSEIEAFACANLVSKMEAGLMDAAPIWSDLKTFPWAEFRGKVDILTGGYPCQPFSAAGKRAGKDDPRHLWPWIADGIRLLQPRCCFFENVEGHITLGLSTVISDLEELGYQTTWGIFSASEVGAPHQRKRVFILAYSASIGGREDHWIGNTRLAHQSDAIWPSRPGEQQHAWEPPRVVADTKLATSSTEIDKREKSINQDGSDLRHEHSTVSSALADSHRIDRSAQAEGREHDRQAAPAGEELGNAASPRPQERTGQRGAGIQGTNADGGEGAEWETKSSMGRDADGPADRMDDAKLYVTCDNRTDELRLLGNGVVPATAEKAFRTLMQKMHE